MKDFAEKEEKLVEREKRNLSILNAIRSGREISRAEIARITDLNIVTVSNYVSKFVRDKLVFETGLDESSGGRRPELLKLNPAYTFSVGIDLGPVHLALGSPVVTLLLDLNGKVVAEEKIKKEKEPFDELTSRVIDMTERLIIRSGIDRSRISGIGVGIWGVLDRFRGMARYVVEEEESVNYAALLARLGEKFGVPVLIEHDANLGAFGEKWSGGGAISEAENLIFLCSDSSCGFIMNGELYYGASKSAGEFNINPPKVSDPAEIEKARCWETYRFGCCLRSRGLDLGIPRQAKKESFAEAVKAAENGDETSMKAIEDAGEYLGAKIAFLINLFNPEVIVVGRGIERAGDIFFSALRKAVREWAYEETAKIVKIIPAALGDSSVAVGAAALVTQKFFAKA